jgi:hypothetical protein
LYTITLMKFMNWNYTMHAQQHWWTHESTMWIAQCTYNNVDALKVWEWTLNPKQWQR